MPVKVADLVAEIVKSLPAANPVYTIEGFCEAHHITKPLYYELKRAGLGPREMEVGRRRLITVEAAAEWRRARERRNGE
ncbi:MAG: hypothetical protein KDH15_03880 [Rhodocyclaceae bacterium]|nr:hypothetical protein [Rhodocyclaceae bacterium]